MQILLTLVAGDQEDTRRQIILPSPLGKVSSPKTDAGSSSRQAVRLYGLLVSFRQAISHTKRFSNPTPFVK